MTTFNDREKKRALINSIGQQVHELTRMGEARRAARRAFADAPGGAGGVPTNSSFEHLHSHSHDDGTEHVHVHWHFAGTNQHSQGSTVPHEHEHEVGLAKEKAGAAYEAARTNRTPGDAESARARAFRESRLSEAQQAVLRAADPAQSPFQKVAGPTLPISARQTSIGPTKAGRQIIDTPMPERKPGETDAEYSNRIRRQVEALGQPTAKTSAALQAAPLGSTDQSAEFGEAGNDARKQKLLADSRLSAAEQDRRTERAVEGLGVIGVTDTTAWMKKAKSLMAARGQSIDPASAGFSERYKNALKEIR